MHDKALVFINDRYLLWSLLSLLAPALLGWWLYGNVVGFGQGLLWGGLIRICLFHNLTWCINSVGHLMGKPMYNTGDGSKNVTWFAILGFGEGYHNNHHAFPRSACFGMDKGQLFDTGWYIVRLLEKLRLISAVVYPPALEERIKKRLSHSGDEVVTDKALDLT
jgi:stearoyl-CoA desaturase (Delta-9 desaturase)